LLILLFVVKLVGFREFVVDIFTPQGALIAATGAEERYNKSENYRMDEAFAHKWVAKITNLICFAQTVIQNCVKSIFVRVELGQSQLIHTYPHDMNRYFEKNHSKSHETLCCKGL
jgi:hypothetical protein